jgi:ribosomal protein L13E
MSDGNASADARETDAGDAVGDDYDWMIEQLDEAISEARRKVESGRVYDAENEKVRIKWIRALAYAVNVRRQITTDRDLEELTERLDQLEERTGVDP